MAQGTPPESATLSSIWTQVEQVRHLNRMSQPDVAMLDHTALENRIADEFHRDYLPSERQRDDKVYSALGMIQPTDDIAQLELTVFSSDIESDYDPETRSIALLSDPGQLGPLQRRNFAGMAAYALQDQHFDLTKLAPQHPDNADQATAVRALITGDSLIVQTLWTQANLTSDEQAAVRDAAKGPPAVWAQVPLLVRDEQAFQFSDGFNFARARYQAAGNSFAGIDAAYQRPPESTAQVLHPDKYTRQVHPVLVHLPDLATQLGADWRQLGSGVLGELDTRIWFQQSGAEAADARRIAAGWSGDRWQFVENGGGWAMVLKSTWETSDSAADVFAAITGGLASRFSDANTDESSTARQALTGTSVATDVRLDGSQVLTIIASDRATADAIAAAVVTATP
jgi:hypothetical protein